METKRCFRTASAGAKLRCRIVDRREVVQVPTIIFCLSMNLLRPSMLCVLLPPDHNGIVTLPSCSSSGILCFPMVFLPLNFAVPFTSKVILVHGEKKNYHNLKSGVDSLFLFSSLGPKHMPQEQKINPCHPKSSMIDLVWCPIVICQPLFEIDPFILHFSRLQSCASRLKIQALLSQQVTQYFASIPRCSVVLGCLLAPISWCSDVTCCCCCCCCDCQALLRTIFGARRGVESLSHKFFHLFEKSLCRCNLSAQICRQLRHEILSAQIGVPLLVLGLN